MLTVNIICIGKIKEKYWTDAIAEYRKRLSAFCRLNIIELAEEKDNGRDLHLLRVSPLAAQSAQIVSRLIEGLPLPTLVLPGKRVSAAENAPLYAPWQPSETEETKITLIPYFAWNNRGKGEMRVWIETE